MRKTTSCELDTYPLDEENAESGFLHDPERPPTGRLIVKCSGHNITRQIPTHIVQIDTRDKYPFDFSRFPTTGEISFRL
jgi:hypothetical protein